MGGLEKRQVPRPGGLRNPPFILRNRFLPTVEVGFQFWPGFLSYQFMMDVENRELSTHQLMLGIDF